MGSRWRFVLAVTSMALCAACIDAGIPQSPAASAHVASPSSAPTSPASVTCQALPNHTYSSPTLGFSVRCPIGFSWQTFANPNFLFSSRIFNEQSASGYPKGQIDVEVLRLDAAGLRAWVEAHTGDPMADPARDFWNSTSNVRNITIDRSPGIAFDYVMRGPDSPNDFHAVAFVLRGNDVLKIDWWAYGSSGYSQTIDRAAAAVVGSITFE